MGNFNGLPNTSAMLVGKTMRESVLAARLLLGAGLVVQWAKPLLTKLISHTGIPVGVLDAFLATQLPANVPGR